MTSTTPISLAVQQIVNKLFSNKLSDAKFIDSIGIKVMEPDNYVGDVISSPQRLVFSFPYDNGDETTLLADASIVKVKDVIAAVKAVLGKDVHMGEALPEPSGANADNIEFRAMSNTVVGGAVSGRNIYKGDFQEQGFSDGSKATKLESVQRFQMITTEKPYMAAVKKASGKDFFS